jgi:hypothetical protein
MRQKQRKNRKNVSLRQNGVGTGFVMADAILPKGHVKTAQSILWRIRERRFSD